MAFNPHPPRRVAVITGASAGIGAATARVLAGLGHPVALGARRVERCEEHAAAIREAGGEAVAIALDVTDGDSVKAFAEEVRGQLGEPEVVVSNAGALITLGAVEASTDQIREDLEINVLGAHRLVSEFAPPMIERQRGDLVFMSSDILHVRRPSVAGYAAGKWGLEGMVTSLQAELEGTGVRASVVRPGATLTEIHKDWKREQLMTLVDLWRRWGVYRHDGILAAEDIAAAVAAVVSVPPGTHLTLVEVQPQAPISRA